MELDLKLKKRHNPRGVVHRGSCQAKRPGGAVGGSQRPPFLYRVISKISMSTSKVLYLGMG